MNLRKRHAGVSYEGLAEEAAFSGRRRCDNVKPELLSCWVSSYMGLPTSYACARRLEILPRMRRGLGVEGGRCKKNVRKISVTWSTSNEAFLLCSSA